MQTQILKIDENSLKYAKQLLSEGQLVAFPTETVYGLGALATNDKAVDDTFKVKGRPNDNPLIVHVHSDYDISKLVEITNDYSLKIAKSFLPAPLTIIYKSKGVVANNVSCGLETLAIRVPENKDAQRFLKYVDMPISAPSANISKHTSPVTATHVYEDFNGKIPLILDGGRCTGGIESTVLDATGELPVILRKGLITAEMIMQKTGLKCIYASENVTTKAKSPGMKYRHYCPNCETILFKRDEIQQAVDAYKSLVSQGKRVVFIADNKMARELVGYRVLNLGSTSIQMACNLYECLHESEKIADVIISFELEITDEVMLSVNNRFSKAFGKGNK